MTDLAFNESSTSLAAAMLARSRDNQQRPVDTVVSLAPRADATSTSADERAMTVRSADFESAIELVREASEAIRIGEERAEELEIELKRMTEQASEEVRRLNSELAAKDALLQKTEDQLRAAEARGDEAEMWLARLHEAVLTSFEPIQRARAPIAPSAVAS